MREFQNRLFIGVKDLGILLFDNMGNYLKTYAETGIDNAGFYGDQIYFIQDNQLVLVNIYNDERKLLTLPAGASWKFIIYSPNDMYLFSNERLSHYRIVEN
jgi:hypothetical protein